MEKRYIGRKILTAAAVLIGASLLVTAGAFIILAVRTASVREDWSSVYQDGRYKEAVSVDGVEVIKQEVSCGYAVIEMFSSWSGHDVTEESLYEEYGKVVTSTAGAFCRQMNLRFPEYRTEVRRYLKDPN